MENKRSNSNSRRRRRRRQRAKRKHKSNLKQENYIHKKFSLGKSLKCLKDDDDNEDVVDVASSPRREGEGTVPKDARKCGNNCEWD